MAMFIVNLTFSVNSNIVNLNVQYFGIIIDQMEKKVSTVTNVKIQS